MSKKVDMTKWNDTQKRVYDWLIYWDYCDEKTASLIVGGGSYEYGLGIEEVNRKDYDNDPDYKEYIDSQEENWFEDTGLPGSGWFLIGSQYQNFYLLNSLLKINFTIWRKLR